MEMYLPMAVKNIGLTLEDILSNISTAEYKLLYYDKISSLYRQIGIGEYLMSNSVISMFSMLQLGIQSYIEFLEKADDSEKAISKIVVFFDAVCCQDKKAMADLALLAPRQLNARKEYDEDFLYMRILMDIFGLGKPREDVQVMLDEYEAFHSENSDERFNIIIALLEKDGKAFHESLELLISERLDRYADGGDLYKGTLEEATILSHVSTEVIAWLWFARIQNIGLSNEYALAPSSSMQAYRPVPLTEGAWRSCESYRSLEYTK